MPKLPVVKSRQSRVSGQPSQVAGALIPDNTQHSWRDDVGMVLKVWLQEAFDHGIGRQTGWAEFWLWPAIELCRATGVAGHVWRRALRHGQGAQ
ncbi:hypothetical protein D3C84_1009320 [compost metagenome]